MASGENPTRAWGHTRMGVAWHLREHFRKAKKLMERQDDYCDLVSNHRDATPADKVELVHGIGDFPSRLDLDTSVGILRGRVIVQNHNYEQEDMETMLRIGREFGFRARGFHHAAEAWQIPEMLKERGERHTCHVCRVQPVQVAVVFAEPLCRAHARQARHSVSGVAGGHWPFVPSPRGRPLRAITSIPATATDLHHRVGYCCAGYDADVVVWDSHPLSVGATPLQVFVDGIPQLDDSKVKESTGTTLAAAERADDASQSKPQIRYEPEDGLRNETCSLAAEAARKVMVKGIRKVLLENYPELAASVMEQSEEPLDLRQHSLPRAEPGLRRQDQNLEADGRPEAVPTERTRLAGPHRGDQSTGHEGDCHGRETGDGDAKGQEIGDPDSLAYAKHGIGLDDKSFARARMGQSDTGHHGPHEGVRRHGSRSQRGDSHQRQEEPPLDGGIVQDDVALHLVLDEGTKAPEDRVGTGVQHLRKMLRDGEGKHNATVYGRVQRGELPLVVTSYNKYDLQQLIMAKRDIPGRKIVIMGGKEAPYAAKDLAPANIPVMLTQNRPSGDEFRNRDAVVGLPLSRSIASHLTEAGVIFAPAIAEDHARGLPPPQSGSGSRLDGQIRRPRRARDGAAGAAGAANVESILGLKRSKDLVVFGGNPLRYGATAVLSFHADAETGKLEVATGFPREEGGIAGRHGTCVREQMVGYDWPMRTQLGNVVDDVLAIGQLPIIQLNRCQGA
ncbi:Uncharacterized protein TCAP_04526 [Tolypocladium capitatum]|uniref:Amidohydrolase-related domain-containing protein n=1 Tax=Tolypocladium capitatum TaxID=45235 RepID=A0A2K3QDD4_9HYPO|nr:Uncharacterized protein TCAP_04526 [Tolypocladium capitatum]